MQGAVSILSEKNGSLSMSSSVSSLGLWGRDKEPRQEGVLGAVRNYSKCSNYLSKQKPQCKKEEKTQETDE